MSLPQGWTNAVAIFHNDVTFMLTPEIPYKAHTLFFFFFLEFMVY